MQLKRVRILVVGALDHKYARLGHILYWWGERGGEGFQWSIQLYWRRYFPYAKPHFAPIGSDAKRRRVSDVQCSRGLIKQSCFGKLYPANCHYTYKFKEARPGQAPEYRRVRRTLHARRGRSARVVGLDGRVRLKKGKARINTSGVGWT